MKPSSIPSRCTTLISVVLIVIATALMFYPGLAAHIQSSAQPNHFNGDVRQWIWPLMRFHDSSLFPDDYIGDYFQALMPLGYKSFFQLTSTVIDPRVMSKVLPPGAWLVLRQPGLLCRSACQAMPIWITWLVAVRARSAIP
jgi:hypothetical protein